MNTKAPKDIYLTFTHNGHIVESDQPIHGNNSIKYIRADLAELTWKDIADIISLFNLIKKERSCNVYAEVLSRFLESKKEIEL